MRRYPVRGTGAVVCVLALLSGCSSDTDTPPASSATSVTTTAAEPPAAAAPVPPGEVAISPGGVTTAVGAPAESTEDDYFQACLAARTWMEQRGGVARSQIEPYLASVQSAPSAGPGTFDRPWPELTPGEQAAVIVAVEAAADALCG
ncbi:MAG: lipoprotein LpqV [Mycolicibacterium vanbaalenii]|uniref:lipoprotein LpqV n=1 Tax=Mycolicibacterium vanbaalenii TaxID=110539 RepID=UPI0035652E52